MRQARRVGMNVSRRLKRIGDKEEPAFIAFAAAGSIHLAFSGDRILKSLDSVILDRIVLQTTPIVAINRIDPVDLNEVYLSGLAGSPITLNRRSLLRHMRANEHRDALSNPLL